MTKLLKQAIEALRKLPPGRQDEAAEILLSVLGQDHESIRLTPEQIAEVERRLGEPAKTSDHAEVRAFFQNQGPRNSGGGIPRSAILRTSATILPKEILAPPKR